MTTIKRMAPVQLLHGKVIRTRRKTAVTVERKSSTVRRKRFDMRVWNSLSLTIVTGVRGARGTIVLDNIWCIRRRWNKSPTTIWASGFRLFGIVPFGWWLTGIWGYRTPSASGTFAWCSCSVMTGRRRLPSGRRRGSRTPSTTGTFAWRSCSVMTGRHRLPSGRRRPSAAGNCGGGEGDFPQPSFDIMSVVHGMGIRRGLKANRCRRKKMIWDWKFINQLSAQYSPFSSK